MKDVRDQTCTNMIIDQNYFADSNSHKIVLKFDL